MKVVFLLLLASCFPLLTVARSRTTVFNVLDYGAVGDGRTDDTNAFLKTWKATCASASSHPIMLVPKGKTFLLHPLSFTGPCKFSAVNVQIDGYIIAPEEPSEWRCPTNCEKWIYFNKVDGLSVYGRGTIDGRGDKWWHGHQNIRPREFEIAQAANVSLSGITFKDSPRMHVILEHLRSSSVSNITILAPRHSPNTDGLHITSSTDIHVDHCRIGTGDDCISIVSGSLNLNISNIICGPGHGISIGSLGKHGDYSTVEHVHVRDVVFMNTDNGARIKTWQGGRGFARHITFERILSEESKNPIIIDQFYCDHEHCINHEDAVKVSHITFRQVLGTSRLKSPAVKLSCSDTVPCQDIVLDDVYILTSDGKNASVEWNNAHVRAQGRMVPNLPFQHL